jgi:predicted nuclease with TOPRIM domain
MTRTEIINEVNNNLEMAEMEATEIRKDLDDQEARIEEINEVLDNLDSDTSENDFSDQTKNYLQHNGLELDE